MQLIMIMGTANMITFILMAIRTATSIQPESAACSMRCSCRIPTTRMTRSTTPSRPAWPAVKISLLGLIMTATLQGLVVIISDSVALLADTIHNLADALTAVPLWIAYALSQRPATRRYTYGYGRVEDLAGMSIVIMITLSALLAGYESIRRFFEPQPVTNLPWVLIAGVIGFAGNELVAVYRIRVGRRIGSAALVADGVHARTDGFTSLAVVLGVIGLWLGIPLADPIVGLVISIAIFVL